MLGKGKEISGRPAASSDDIRLFSKALELLSSTNPDSEHELLELVKKAKRDADKDLVADFTRKAAAGLQSTNSSNEVAVVSSGLPAVGATAANSSHAQVHLVHAARSGSSRGPIEKPKRKTGR